jgi:hypothetical protein
MLWFRFWLTMAAWYQWASEATVNRLRQWRSRLFYKLLSFHDPRPMLLLKNGQWVDVDFGFGMDQVAWVYDARRHMIHRPLEVVVGRGERWPWLGAVEQAEGGRDLTDFFTELKVSRGPSPSVATVLGLFAHQKGWMPRGFLAVTRRDGEEMVLDAVTGSVVASSEEAVASVAHVDHIQ